jgi:hypothetical protein
VIEMDVREEEVADVAQVEPAPAQSGLERFDARGRPALEERRAVLGVEQVRADDALGVSVAKVDRRHVHAPIVTAPPSYSAAVDLRR